MSVEAVSPPAAWTETAEELYEEAPCGYLSTLPDGTIVRVNGTFLRWIGRRREDLLSGKRFQDLLSVPGRIFHETHMAPLLAMHGSVREVALEILCADGRRLPILVNSVQKRDGEGKPLFTRTTVIDATERRAYERELLLAKRKAEETAAAKAGLVAMISHDIRSALNGILGSADLLGETEMDADQRALLGYVREAAAGLLSLSDGILAASKAEAGGLALDERPFDPRELAQRVGSLVRPKAEAKGISVGLKLDDALPPLLVGDAVKIEQVLTNLMGNAVKFTERGGVILRIEVAALAERDATLRVEVRDTGIGIAPDRRAQVFEEFTQESAATAARYGGTGLGLAICRKLLALYGSEISLDSEPGRGSAFSFPLRLRLG